MCTLFFMTKLLVHEAHSGGLMGYFGIKKTLEISNKHFHWL